MTSEIPILFNWSLSAYVHITSDDLDLVESEEQLTDMLSTRAYLASIRLKDHLIKEGLWNHAGQIEEATEEGVCRSGEGKEVGERHDRAHPPQDT